MVGVLPAERVALTPMAAATARVQRDASLYFIGKGGAAIGLVVAIPLVTRGLDATAFADFALWSGVALWSATACVGWLQTGVGRLHRERCGTARFAGYFASVRAAIAIAAIASAALVIGLALAWSPFGVVELLAFGSLAAASTLFMGSQALAQADLDAARVVKSDLVRGGVLPLALGVLALVGGLGLATATFAHAFALFCAIAWSRARSFARDARPDWSELRPLLRYGVPVGLWSVICLASAQLGRTALELAGDPAALGLFAAMQDVIVKGGTLLLMPVVSAIHAHAMAWWADGDHASIHRGLRRAFAIQAVIGGTLVVGALVCGPLLARILFAENTSSPATTMSVAALLAAGVVASNMGLLAHKGLELGHATRTMVALAIVGLAVNVVLCVVLVPICGAIGAALAFAIAQSVYAMTAWLCSRRRMTQLGVRVPIRAASRSGRTQAATV